MKRMACALALATGSGAIIGSTAQQALADPVSAVAASGLQLSIAATGALTSDIDASLDVKYRGGTIRSVELFVDNVKVFRKAVKFNQTQGNFNLEVDKSLLPEGDHDIIVVAIENDGSTATTSVKLHISGPEVDGTASFVYPRKNAVVQNVVPIELKIDPSIKSPYVAYTLDNDSLAIRNFAPYVYNWDTSKISDGPHTIGVEIYDGTSQQILKKMTIMVVVKNIGGFTSVQKETPVISTNTSPLKAIFGEAVNDLSPKNIDDASGLISRAISPTNNYSLRSTEPQIAGAFKSSKNTRSNRADNLRPDGIGAKHSPGVPALPAGHPFMGNIAEMVAEPDFIATTPTSPVTLGEQRIARVKVKTFSAGNMAYRPSQFHSEAPVQKPIMVAQYVAPRIRTFRAQVVNTFHSFQLAFNKSVIAFDVKPRIENGMPLAPFRAIFEHSGGSVHWYGKSKTIRAVSSTRQIEFTIGSSVARVNNQLVNLAHKPYVENGRTIVPISFVRDAMNVKVTYDPKHGQLNLDSAR